MASEGSAERIRGYIVERLNARFAAAFDQCKHGEFATVARPHPSEIIREFPLRAATLFNNKGFIGFDDFAFAADWPTGIIVHTLADAMFHEPRRLVIDLKRAVHLVGAEAFF